MKRSKMLNKISNFLYEHNLEPEEADSEADILLRILEDAGMLPPSEVTMIPFNSKDALDMYNKIYFEWHQWEKE